MLFGNASGCLQTRHEPLHSLRIKYFRGLVGWRWDLTFLPWVGTGSFALLGVDLRDLIRACSCRRGYLRGRALASLDGYGLRGRSEIVMPCLPRHKPEETHQQREDSDASQSTEPHREMPRVLPPG